MFTRVPTYPLSSVLKNAAMAAIRFGSVDLKREFFKDIDHTPITCLDESGVEIHSCYKLHIYGRV